MKDIRRKKIKKEKEKGDLELSLGKNELNWKLYLFIFYSKLLFYISTIIATNWSPEDYH